MVPLDALDDANVLLRAPAFCPGEARACADLLSAVDPERTALLGVSPTRSPDQWLSAVADRLPALPGTVWLVDVGEGRRTAAAEGPVRRRRGDVDVTVATVPNPGNLTDLGVELTRGLDAVTGAEGPTDAVMCFESAGTLYHHADDRTVYQFFHELTERVAAADVRAHYHVTRGAMDERVERHLLLLFDTVVTVAEDGGVSVDRR